MSGKNQEEKDVYAALRAVLAPLYDEREAQQIAFLVLDEAFGVSRVDVYARKVRQFSEEERKHFANILQRLGAGEPVQYVLGTAPFCGRSFGVTPATLIPRPETEELVGLALSALRHAPGEENLRLLDVGTGTGCIASTLALELQAEGRAAAVEAWDISAEALAVAAENARRLGAVVDFRRVDALAAADDLTRAADDLRRTSDGLTRGADGLGRAADDLVCGAETLEKAGYTLIVSNPPYICEAERAEMTDHVLRFEPATALFVPDADPLRFYRALAEIARRRLRRGGTLAVEANTAYAAQTAALFREKGLTDVRVLDDAFSRPRFVVARREKS